MLVHWPQWFYQTLLHFSFVKPLIDDCLFIYWWTAMCFELEISDRIFGNRWVSCWSQRTAATKGQKNVSGPCSKANTAEYSKSRERKSVPEVCMCVHVYLHVYRMRIQKKKNGQLSLFCKSIVWHKDGKGSHSPLVLPLYEEQTVLISVTHTRSTLQPTGKVQQQQQQCLPRLQNK